MNRLERQFRLITALNRLGITTTDALALRKIEMTLHRWAERECGDEHGNAIERDELTGIPYATYDMGMRGERGRYRIADKEQGALKRLAKIMAAYPTLVAYHQGDPRGCALYIVRRSDLGEDRPIESYYTRGVAVCA
jgi:hypothetical protein